MHFIRVSFYCCPELLSRILFRDYSERTLDRYDSCSMQKQWHTFCKISAFGGQNIAGLEYCNMETYQWICRKIECTTLLPLVFFI